MKPVWAIILLVAVLELGQSVATDVALAQIIPDDSLGAERSRLMPVNPQVDTIMGGARRGANLFHSFRRFNVESGRSVYFANPDGVTNILSRVTGSDRTQILGTLGVQGRANLFLLNPNGILFGRSARLDVQGSFVGTTASAFQFGTQGNFSAINPQSPALLTVQPSAFLFGQVPGAIEYNGAPIPPGSPATGLQVPRGQSLLLVGGDVALNGGGLNALEGRVELAGLSGTGAIGLNSLDNSLQLQILPESTLATVSLTNDARVSVRGNGGGDIVVNANIFSATRGGRLIAGTEGNRSAGDIRVNANLFTLSGQGQVGREGIRSPAGLFNDIQGSGPVETSANNTGDILINANVFSADRGAEIRSAVLPEGRGDAGDIRIRANTMTLDGKSTRINAITAGEGSAGRIAIESQSLALSNTAFIVADTFGRGRGGDIFIRTHQFTVRTGGQVASNSGRGIESSAQRQILGRGGDINITANAIELADVAGFRSGIFAETSSRQRAGDLTIRARQISIRDGAAISAGHPTTGSLGGDGGNLKITAQDFIEVTGQRSVEELGQNRVFRSTITTDAAGQGDAGNLSLTTGRLLIQNGAAISSNSSSQGDAGRIVIRARSIDLRNQGQINSSIEQNASGNAGDIRIRTRSLSLDQSRITASTSGEGEAGDIILQDIDQIQLLNSALLTDVQSSANGAGGSIRIHNADSLALNNSQISARSQARNSNAGNIEIVLRNQLTSTDGSITTSSEQASGGAINITAPTMQFRQNSSITTNVNQGEGGGGDIVLTADNAILAFDNSDIIASANEQGGDILLNTIAFVGENYQPTYIQSRGNRSDNRVDIDASGDRPGNVEVPSPTFLQNSLVELPQASLNTEILLANSCIQRRPRQRDRTVNRFIVTGSDGLPSHPGNASLTTFPTGTIRRLDTSTTSDMAPSWQLGDAIIEPQGVYQLSDGRLVLSRECSESTL